MCADDIVIDGVAVPQLDFDTPAQWREHLSEDDLLVPHRLVAAFLHCSAALRGIRVSVRDMLSLYKTG